MNREYSSIYSNKSVSSARSASPGPGARAATCATTLRYAEMVRGTVLLTSLLASVRAMTSAGDGGGCISNTSPWRVPTAAQASLASGGAIVVTFEGGEVIALESSFSEPGPTDYSLNTEVDVGWTSLVVNRSGTARGVLGHVLATRPEWTLRRTVVWPHNSHALLVNDTLTALGGEVVGTWVTHSAVFLPSAGRPAAAILPGLSNGYQCDASYYETPGDLYTNNGRPDVFANSSLRASQSA